MDESEKQFSFTRAPSSTTGAPKTKCLSVLWIAEIFYGFLQQRWVLWQSQGLRACRSRNTQRNWADPSVRSRSLSP